MTDREQQTQEAIERVNEALGNMAEALHKAAPQFEKAASVLREFGKYPPIPVEGTVK